MTQTLPPVYALQRLEGDRWVTIAPTGRVHNAGFDRVELGKVERPRRRPAAKGRALLRCV
jgi:hypothetical protein